MEAIPGAASNRTCQLCMAREASHFCNCLNPPTLFCMTCFPAHHAKYPRIIHNTIPIAALHQPPAEYMNKYEALTQGVAELRKNIERIDQYYSEFDELMKICIGYLTEYRGWWLQHIQTEREALAAAVETAVQEATACLDQGTQPGGLLAQALWTLPSDQLQMVNCSVTPPDLQTLCQTWTSYQNNLQSVCERIANIPRRLFAAVFMNQVQLYDLSTHQSTLQNLPVDFGWGGSYIPLSSNSLMCLGPTKSVYELDLASIQLSPLPGLRVPRAYAGVAKNEEFVYIFGGQGQGMKVLNSSKSTL